MNTRPTDPTPRRTCDVEQLLRQSPPIERAPAWLRASTMDRIARAQSADARPPLPAPPPAASLLWRLAPLAGLAAAVALAVVLLRPSPAPKAPPTLVIDDAPPAPLLTPETTTAMNTAAAAEAFRTLRSLAKRPDLQPSAVVHARVEEPLLREARLVAQDSENVARAVLARLPIPSSLN